MEFPPAESTHRSGVIAVGGDLSPKRVLAAYERGIFPWFSEGDPILWWCPDPRYVLYPEELHVSRSLAQRIRSGRFAVRFDTAFDRVVDLCATAPRRGGPGTWLTEELRRTCRKLHRLGVTHSAESWSGGRLVGGLYGAALGGIFFGESMFTLETDASKVAFVTLVRRLAEWGFRLIDCQMYTAHLRRFGARHIRRADFLAQLAECRRLPGRPGPWTEMPEPARVPGG